jgi:hypothetical protein
MRPVISPEQFRAAGIYLNGGQRRGWRKRLAQLLDTPETTIASWASRTPSNARSIPGSTVVALKLLVTMVRQCQLTEGDLRIAARIVSEQVLELVGAPDSLPTVTDLPPPRAHPGENARAPSTRV